MIDLYIEAIRTDIPRTESPQQTRDRLKSVFPPGNVRRMTQLGLLVGASIRELQPTLEDTVVYATEFGESRAMESYLDSFPGPSPTLFQTSIHPSGVQQSLIGTQQPIRELLPLAGGPELTIQALLVAALSPAPRVIFCGGEERATWLTEHGVASEHSFAFACALRHSPGPASLGKITLKPTTGSGALSLYHWCRILQERTPIAAPAAAGWQLHLEWFPEANLTPQDPACV